MNEFWIIDSHNLTDKILKQKLAYPYEYVNLHNFFEQLNLTKKDYWSH